MSATMVGQWPAAELVTTATAVPVGRQADPVHSTTHLTSDGLPTALDRTIDVRVPAGTAPGDYPVAVTMQAYGVRTITRTVTITVP